MKTIKDLKVGDTVWYTDCNHRRGTVLQETTVVDIKTKLITTAGFRGMKFYKETLRGNDKNYGGHYQLYLEDTIFNNEKRADRLKSLIREYSNTYGKCTTPLDVLEQVVVLLGLTVPTPEES